eukprot:31068-Pelagococcus_subviridis.AAC.9
MAITSVISARRSIAACRRGCVLACFFLAGNSAALTRSPTAPVRPTTSVRSDIRDATSKAATSFAAAGGASRAPVGERGCGVERGDMFKDRRAGFSRGGDGATVFPRRSGLFAGDRYRALSRNGDATAPSGTGGKPPAPFSTTRALCGGDAGAAAAAAFSRAFSSFFFRFGDVGGVGARVAAVA